MLAAFHVNERVVSGEQAAAAAQRAVANPLLRKRGFESGEQAAAAAQRAVAVPDGLVYAGLGPRVAVTCGTSSAQALGAASGQVVNQHAGPQALVFLGAPAAAALAHWRSPGDGAATGG